MKIIVCIKQVPDTTDIKWTENNTIQREGVESVINPYDVYALEEALKLKYPPLEGGSKSMISGRGNTEITVLTMGPLQADNMLRKAIALGCDNGVLISDKKFAGADTYATGKTIASAIKSKMSDFDLIICGQFAVDGDTAQTGPSIASQLGIPQVTYVRKLDRFDGESIYAERELEEGTETVKVQLPALICVLKGFNEPTRPTIDGIKRAKNADITVYSMEDIGLTPEEVGIKGSPTFVSKAFRPENKRGECTFCDDLKCLTDKISEFGGLNG